jgi:hypothetical protein
MREFREISTEKGLDKILGIGWRRAKTDNGKKDAKIAKVARRTQRKEVLVVGWGLHPR